MLLLLLLVLFARPAAVVLTHLFQLNQQKMDPLLDVFPDAEQLQASYAQELSAYKQELTQLKTSFMKRQIAKARLLPAEDVLSALGPVAEADDPLHEAALQRLKAIVGKELLEVTVPTAADTLHKKVCAPVTHMQHTRHHTVKVCHNHHACMCCC